MNLLLSKTAPQTPLLLSLSSWKGKRPQTADRPMAGRPRCVSEVGTRTFPRTTQPGPAFQSCKSVHEAKPLALTSLMKVKLWGGNPQCGLCSRCDISGPGGERDPLRRCLTPGGVSRSPVAPPARDFLEAEQSVSKLHTRASTRRRVCGCAHRML